MVKTYAETEGVPLIDFKRGERKDDVAGVTPHLYVDHKHSRIKQYHKEGRALRTETVINDAYDFGIGKRLVNLPALREVGARAN